MVPEAIDECGSKVGILRGTHPVPGFQPRVVTCFVVFQFRATLQFRRRFPHETDITLRRAGFDRFNPVPATGLDFTSILLTAITVATPTNATTTCTGGTLTAVAGGGLFSYTGGTVAAATTCIVAVDVTSVVPGAHEVSIELVSSLGNTTAVATLTVAGINGVEPIPTTSQWALLLMALAFVGAAWWVLRR